jgi:hypothetical protein
MITFVRTAAIHEGKLMDAMEWAADLAEYIRDNIEGANLQAARHIGGEMYQVCWIATYDSLAAFEEVMGRMEADDGYRERLSDARGMTLFVSHTVFDEIYQSIG